MKKTICIVAVLLLLISMITACGEKEYECALCKETFEGKANIYKYDGRKIPFCDDCYEVISAFGPMIEDYIEEYAE